MNVRMRELLGMNSGTRVMICEPNPEDLALIAGEEFAGSPVSPDDVHVRDVLLCHNQHDYTLERFPKAYLDRFAETIPGKSVLPGHDTGELPIGRWFRGKLQQRVEREFPLAPSFEPGQAKVTWLRAGFYFPEDVGTELFRKNLDTGVYRWVSIGFRYDDLICDACGKSYLGSDCPHIIGRAADKDDDRIVMATYGGDPKKAQALEGSLVFLGAQQRARVTRAIRDGSVDPKTLSMTPYGEDSVARKSLEALARENGHAPHVWSGHNEYVNIEHLPEGPQVTPVMSFPPGATAADITLAMQSAAEAIGIGGTRTITATSNFSPDFSGGKAESIDAAEEPSFGGVDETAAIAAMEGGENTMTDQEKAAVETAENEKSPDMAAAMRAMNERMEGMERRMSSMDQAMHVGQDALQAAETRAETAQESAGALKEQLEARSPLADAGEKALNALRVQILADEFRLDGAENPLHVRAVDLMVQARDYDALVDTAKMLRAKVCERFPTELSGISGEPGEPGAGTISDAEHILRAALR